MTLWTRKLFVLFAVILAPVLHAQAQIIEVVAYGSTDFGTVGLDVTAPTRVYFRINNLDASVELVVNAVTSSDPDFIVLQPTSNVR